MLANLKPAQSDSAGEGLDGLEAMGSGINSDLFKMLEEDRKVKNSRFQDMYNLIEQNRTMQNELIN